jgi:hypothetical protein
MTTDGSIDCYWLDATEYQVLKQASQLHCGYAGVYATANWQCAQISKKKSKNHMLYVTMCDSVMCSFCVLSCIYAAEPKNSSILYQKWLIMHLCS